MVTTFCDRLGWCYLRALLDGFAERLAFGVRRDLTELVRLTGVDGARARAFHAAALTSIAQLAKAPASIVQKALKKAVPFTGWVLSVFLLFLINFGSYDENRYAEDKKTDWYRFAEEQLDSDFFRNENRKKISDFDLLQEPTLEWKLLYLFSWSAL